MIKPNHYWYFQNSLIPGVQKAKYFVISLNFCPEDNKKWVIHPINRTTLCKKLLFYQNIGLCILTERSFMGERLKVGSLWFEVQKAKTQPAAIHFFSLQSM